MGYAVELVLEKPGAESIDNLFELTGSILVELDASPHVSLAVFEEVDTARLTDVVRDFAEQTQPLVVRFSSIGIFPGEENVIFLAPVVTGELLALHKGFHDRLEAAELASEPYYLPGTWVPHCTITMSETLSQALESIEIVHRAGVMGEYRISEIEVVAFPEVVKLAAYSLSRTNSE